MRRRTQRLTSAIFKKLLFLLLFLYYYHYGTPLWAKAPKAKFIDQLKQFTMLSLKTKRREEQSMYLKYWLREFLRLSIKYLSVDEMPLKHVDH